MNPKTRKTGNKLGTIYYIVDDIFSPKLSKAGIVKNIQKRTLLTYLFRCLRGHHRPIGGIKMNYLHCLLLQQAGFDAKPLVMGRYNGNFFGYDIETASVNEIGYNLKANDVVVCNEFYPYTGLQFQNCIKVIFVQGWTTINKRMRPEDIGKPYSELGYHYVMSCSRFNTNYLKENLRTTAQTVTNGVDDRVFYDDPAVRERGRILCLPRKNPEDIEKIQSLVKQKFPDAKFVAVDNLTQDELANEYRRADIFLATGYPEGFSLPPLEAMSSGCAVVGFTGGGGSEFMINRKTALTAKDGDCEAAAEHLLELLLDDRLKESLRENGLEVAQKYSLAQTQEQLLAFFTSLEEPDQIVEYASAG